MSENLEVPQLAYIGLIASRSAQLEDFIDTVIASASGLNEKQNALFLQGKMIATKLDILAELMKMRNMSTARKARISSIIGRIRHLNHERVTAVHGTWQPRNGWNLMNILLPPPADDFAAVFKGKQLDARQLARVAKSIKTAHEDLRQFWKDVWITPHVNRKVAKKAKSA